ncbi:MAG: hypothetical protein KC964_20005, partial [Candidatus Omnitrophica bacterium]|nr:hypothetical protein [Candidatus Omnitrophota bacterium]
DTSPNGLFTVPKLAEEIKGMLDTDVNYSSRAYRQRITYLVKKWERNGYILGNKWTNQRSTQYRVLKSLSYHISNGCTWKKDSCTKFRFKRIPFEDFVIANLELLEGVLNSLNEAAPRDLRNFLIEMKNKWGGRGKELIAASQQNEEAKFEMNKLVVYVAILDMYGQALERGFVPPKAAMEEFTHTVGKRYKKLLNIVECLKSRWMLVDSCSSN